MSAVHTHTIQTAPLRLITDRPSQLTERLECGHVISRPLGLGEDATRPSKVKRRRCHHCAALLNVEGF